MSDPLDLLDGTEASPVPASPASHHRSIARARRTDPPTSHDAALAFTVSKLRASQYEIFRLLTLYGPAHDEEIERRAKLHGVHQKGSGIRTRRHELVELTLLQDSGTRVLLPDSRRESIVWEVNPNPRLTPSAPSSLV